MDILRGIALVGILLMNIEWFNRSIEDLGRFDETLTGFDHAVAWLVRCFVEGKFYKIFALLFGMGFAVMLIRAQDAGRPFVAWFTRRMLVLYAIGILHIVFLFAGDILHDYALAGLLLLGWILLFRTRRLARFNDPDTFLKIAVVVLLMPFIVATVASLGFGLYMDPSKLDQRWQDEQYVAAEVDARMKEAAEKEDVTEADEAVESEAADDAEESIDADEDAATGEDADSKEDEIEKKISDRVENRTERETWGKEEVEAFAEGSYWDASLYRARASLRLLPFSPFFGIALLLPIFLVGYWFVASGVLRHHREHRRLFTWMAVIGMTLGLFLSAGSLTILQHPVSEMVRSIRIAGEGMYYMSQFALSAGYVGCIVLATQTARGQRWLKPFAPMGRMALTNYIMHSLILVLIFHNYGAGMFSRISRGPQMLIVVAIIGFQMVFSAWWLARYRFGPLEWVWRSLTYKSWQPMRIAA